MDKAVPYNSSDSQDSINLTNNEQSIEAIHPRRKAQSIKPVAQNSFLFISNPLRIKWDVCVIILAVFNCFIIPFTVAFESVLDTSLALQIVNGLIDLVFMVDIYLNFNTSYIDIKTGDEIIDKRQIASNYVRSGRLLLDLLASIPFDLLNWVIGVNSSVSLIKLLKLLRILRLGKIINNMRVKEDIKMTIRIIRLIVFILIYLHFLACSWHILVDSSREWVQSSDTVFNNRDRYYHAESLHQYSFSFYSALGTLVRYEVGPATRYEYLFCMFWVVVGALLISYLLGEITVLVSNINSTLTAFFHTMDTISTTMRSLKLPEPLQLLIVQNFIYSNQLILNHKEWEKFQRIVPPSLIRQINLHLYCDVLSSHSVFLGNNEVIQEAVLNLEYQFVMPDTYLIEAGDESSFFSFIVKGIFEVWVTGLDVEDCLVKELREGEYCGEIGLLYNIRRTASVRAIRYCSMGVLSESKFKKMLKKNSEVERDMKLKITEYKDPFRSRVMKSMKKIPYLRRLDPLTMDRIFYSLKRVNFESDCLLFEKGSVASQVYFVLEGTVGLYMNIYDSGCQRQLHRRGRFPGVEMKYRSEKTLIRSKERSRFEREMNPAKLVELPVVEIDEEGILCAYQALLKNYQHTHCVALCRTKTLVLTADTIYQVAASSYKLQLAINNAKKKYSHVSPLFSEPVVVPPIIDYYKKVPSQNNQRIKDWKIFKLFKNLVFRVVTRKRKNITGGYFSHKALINKLKAIASAEERGWIELAKRIESAELPPKAIFSAELLSIDEMGKPIYNQFASLAMQTVNIFSEAQEHLHVADDRNESLKIQRKRFKLLLGDICQILNLLKSYM